MINIIPPKLADYQKAFLYSEARFTVVEASTKVGKTFSHIWWLFREAHQEHLKPGSEVWWIAPVYGQTEIAFNRMRRRVANVDGYTVNLSDLTITTPLQTVIRFKSAEKPDNLYGEDVHAAVFDEFTRAREEAWFTLRSTLTATKGKCKFIGNVKGRGWGYSLAQRAKSDGKTWRHFKVTAYHAVEAGILSLEEVESARQDLPEHVFKELYLAEPNDDGSNPFGLQHIANCILPLSNRPVVCLGADLAKSVDYTVFVGLDSAGTVSLYDRFQSSWALTKEKLLLLPKSPLAMDSTGVGDPITEELQRVRSNVEGFKFTQQSKQQLIEGLILAVQQGKIKFPDGPIRNEMETFEYEHTRTGVKYTAPAGMHDDCVMALALAWYKFRKVTHTVSMSVGGGF